MTLQEYVNSLKDKSVAVIGIGVSNIPLACYEFLSAKTKEEQEHIYHILLEMDKYKNN